MARYISLIARTLIAAFILLYIGDWVVLAVRQHHGTGTDTVQVDLLLSTTLKNHRDEYDDLGTTATPCVRSIFPHGYSPCWWLRRHATQWE
jgi:hypothetical protein